MELHGDHLRLSYLLSQHGARDFALVALVVGIAIIVFDYVRMLALRRRMPPGPFPLPIVGNTFSLPDTKPWIYFESLARSYNSSIITFWIGRKPTIWLNDAWTASDLLDKRAGIYSSRPRMVVFAELGAGQSNLVNMYYGDRWCMHRKLTHLGVGRQQLINYQPFQNQESQLVARDLLRWPDQFAELFERYATSVVSIIGFGRRVARLDDPIITDVIRVMQRAAELNVPGKSFPMLMETFPILARFPNRIAPWKKGLGRKRGSNFFFALAAEARDTPDCYISRIFNEAPKYDLSSDEIASLTGNLFGAGSDTSASTLITFVLACCAFLETLPRAWEELDRVVGHDRSPTWEDEGELKYVKAFVKEVFRWRSVAIIGGQPHAPIRDDWYRGWFLPRGTWVQGNLDRFNPLRFLPVSDGGDGHPPFPNERGYMTFGWGRRVCAGQGLAEQGTFITIARLLWGFNIRKAIDPDTHKEKNVDIFAYTDGLNMRPQPFTCRIEPRNEQIRQTIEREGKEADEALSVYNGETTLRAKAFS